MASRIQNLSNQLGASVATPSTSHSASVFCEETSAQTNTFGTVGTKSPDDVVIVSAVRTPICKAKRGAFKETTPDDLLLATFKGLVERTKIDPSIVQDIVVGNTQMVGAYNLPARTAQFRSGIPFTCALRTVNRQCSSGIQSVASVASEIAAGYIDCGIGAGVESMTHGGSVGDASQLPPMNMNEIFQHSLARDALTPMGVTSENVAERYGITREEQDGMAVESHLRALRAQKEGRFDREIIPVTVTVEDKEGNEQEITVTKDEGPREGTSMEKLAKLKAVFKKGGSTTAGNASQVSDGAAAVLLMRRSKADALGLPVEAVFRGYKVTGVEPSVMGIGPAEAIPALLAETGVTVGDVDVYEINEAFASQATYCVKKLGIPMPKVNPNGGAIALGHPLGCTGSRQVATLVSELKRTDGKLGVISMCIGTGMGAAALLEAQ